MAPLARKPAEEWTPARQFEARYDGSCQLCHLPIYVGQLVEFSAHDDGSRTVVHAGCA